jgi:3-deoxy-D-manno-octulosonate 8-phosphate phosphatase (KDO 8-P phosphatase)
LEQLEQLFTRLGGRFVSSPQVIRQKLLRVKAFVFDWDGVFNSGEKTSSSGSTFTEVDSMGVNLLRFGYYMRNAQLPSTLIISGEKNDTAFYYSERENFRYSFYKVAHKLKALDHFCELSGLQPAQVCYFFDDVLDIPIAERCGLRIQVNQGVNPLFVDHCVRHKLADYITSAPGNGFAVREACELLIGLGNDFDAVLKARKDNEPVYQQYITERRQVKPEFFTLKEDRIQQIDPRS